MGGGTGDCADADAEAEDSGKTGDAPVRLRRRQIGAITTRASTHIRQNATPSPGSGTRRSLSRPRACISLPALPLRRLQLSSLRDAYPDMLSTEMLEAWTDKAYEGSLVDDFKTCMERKRRVRNRGGGNTACNSRADSRRHSRADDGDHGGASVDHYGCSDSDSDSSTAGGCSDSGGGCSDSW